MMELKTAAKKHQTENSATLKIQLASTNRNSASTPNYLTVATLEKKQLTHVATTYSSITGIL